MGLKSLTLQMIPWCFHVSGGAAYDGAAIPTNAPARVIGFDGRVRVFHHPVPAAELMEEHPLHLLCRSDSFFIGQRVPPLSASDRLQPGQSYLLLPSSFFHSALSFVSLSSSLAAAAAAPPPNNGDKKKQPISLIRPFDIHKTDSGTLQIRVSDEFLRRVSEEEEEVVMERKGRRVCTTEALEKDYKQLVRCKSRQWKPKLETIRENKWERRRGGGLRTFAGAMRMRKKGKIVHDAWMIFYRSL